MHYSEVRLKKLLVGINVTTFMCGSTSSMEVHMFNSVSLQWGVVE